MIRPIWLVALWWLWLSSDQDAGKILRPQDGAALPSGEFSIIATAPGGKLLLDGEELQADQPFPNVLQTKASPAPGKHRLTLVWEDRRSEINFFVGADPPAEFKPFRQHPPVSVECTQCHAVSRRGRLRFIGGCFSCHQQETFPKSHHHPPHILEQCGQCHNAHGSTVKAHLILAREKACGLCHTAPGAVKQGR